MIDSLMTPSDPSALFAFSRGDSIVWFCDGYPPSVRALFWWSTPEGRFRDFKNGSIIEISAV